MSVADPQPAMPKPTRRWPRYVRWAILAVVLISMPCGLAIAVRRGPVIVVQASQRWSAGLSHELQSFPLSKTVPSTDPPFVIDAAKPWKIELGRGSGRDGLDTAALTHDGTVLLYRLTRKPTSGARGASWETAEMALPHEAVSSILAAAAENRLLKLERAYHADVRDGTQWVLRISQGTNEKSVYFDNHFPGAIVRFADLLDAVLARNGVGTVRWEPVPAGQGRKHEKGLWDSIKQQ
ncbi:MAG: hypothetical protein ABSG86_23755 [Thermoguttaceae bacterium]